MKLNSICVSSHGSHIYCTYTNLNLNMATQMTVPDLNQFLVCIVLQIMAEF